MNDPHVVSMTYRMKTGSMIAFDNALALTNEQPAFRMILDTGVLTVTLKTHHATEDQARSVVEPVLRAWEIDAGLKYGIDAFSFSFEHAEVIDRNPPPPGTPGVIRVSVSSRIEWNSSVRGVAVLKNYCPPPTSFQATEAVQVMWSRYKQYRDGKEPLLAMAYACLSFLEGTTNEKTGARTAVCKLYYIDQKVRDKLGDIVSEKGGPVEARKLGVGATHKPLTPQEKQWVEDVIKALIRRKGEHDSDPRATWPQIELSQFVTV